MTDLERLGVLPVRELTIWERLKRWALGKLGKLKDLRDRARNEKPKDKANKRETHYAIEVSGSTTVESVVNAHRRMRKGNRSHRKNLPPIASIDPTASAGSPDAGKHTEVKGRSGKKP